MNPMSPNSLPLLVWKRREEKREYIEGQSYVDQRAKAQMPLLCLRRHQRERKKDRAIEKESGSNSSAIYGLANLLAVARSQRHGLAV